METVENIFTPLLYQAIESFLACGKNVDIQSRFPQDLSRLNLFPHRLSYYPQLIPTFSTAKVEFSTSDISGFWYQT
ncbi:hypothetical protein D0962_00475 [Leptolyngbyaceae cyanobacterium CCMR0082]|uniref:Uncharacterized protein n=1 Tax=Adonisia turfae CCMR0082 TaxID=2304604 RepID=A0A6M0RYG4_9CYAN|nr:hypothetical protein [Adonisia turfae CCMR0082]